jgi:hypothetical protein
MINKKSIFDFFIAKKLAAPILDRKGIQNWDPALYDEICQFESSYYPNSRKKFSEIIYCYLKDIKENPICELCGKAHNSFKQFSKGYFSYCSVKCSSNSEKKKKTIEETCLSKFQHKNVAHGRGIKEKISKTIGERYGSKDNFYKTIVEKSNKSVKERYGVDHIFQSNEIKEKIKITLIENYGSLESAYNHIAEKSKETLKSKGNYRKFLENPFESLENYRKCVRVYTNESYEQHKDIINPKGLARGRTKHQLDHIFPIFEGYNMMIDPKDLSHYKNLQIIHHRENKKKSNTTSLTVIDFYRLIDKKN